MPVSSPTEHAQPHGLDLVIDFVNTLDEETDVDELATPHELAAWLAERRLLESESEAIGEAQRRQAIALREALRAVMLEHNGLAPAPEAAAELDSAARRGQLEVRFDDDGSARFAPREAGFAGAIAKLLVPVVESRADGSWQRVKACRAADCQWAFYDNSRNRSGVWCEMAVCGNRTKVRAYRRRKPRAAVLPRLGSDGAGDV